MKSLQLDENQLRPQFLVVDEPAGIVGFGHIDVGGGRYRRPYLRFLSLVVRIGKRQCAVLPFTWNRVIGGGDGGAIGATRMQFQGRVKINPIALVKLTEHACQVCRLAFDGADYGTCHCEYSKHDQLSLCSGTLVKFLR